MAAGDEETIENERMFSIRWKWWKFGESEIETAICWEIFFTNPGNRKHTNTEKGN